MATTEDNELAVDTASGWNRRKVPIAQVATCELQSWNKNCRAAWWSTVGSTPIQSG